MDKHNLNLSLQYQLNMLMIVFMQKSLNQKQIIHLKLFVLLVERSVVERARVVAYLPWSMKRGLVWQSVCPEWPYLTVR